MYYKYLKKIKKGWRTEDPEILKIRSGTGYPIIFDQIDNGWITEDPKLLLIKSDEIMGERSAGELQVYNGWLTEDPKLLALHIADGSTLAHVQARRGWRTEDPEILSLETREDSEHYDIWTVWDVQIENGWVTEDPELLKLKDSEGNPLACYQAIYGWVTEDPEILKISQKDELGEECCVAGFQILTSKWFSRDFDILSRKHEGKFLIEWQFLNGWELPKDMEDKYIEGISVKDMFIKHVLGTL